MNISNMLHFVLKLMHFATDPSPRYDRCFCSKLLSWSDLVHSLLEVPAQSSIIGKLCPRPKPKTMIVVFVRGRCRGRVWCIPCSKYLRGAASSASFAPGHFSLKELLLSLWLLLGFGRLWGESLLEKACRRRTGIGKLCPKAIFPKEFLSSLWLLLGLGVGGHGYPWLTMDIHG